MRLASPSTLDHPRATPRVRPRFRGALVLTLFAASLALGAAPSLADRRVTLSTGIMTVRPGQTLRLHAADTSPRSTLLRFRATLLVYDDRGRVIASLADREVRGGGSVTFEVSTSALIAQSSRGLIRTEARLEATDEVTLGAAIFSGSALNPSLNLLSNEWKCPIGSDPEPTSTPIQFFTDCGFRAEDFAP